MDDLWNLVSNAHVRSAIVVEVNVSLDDLVGMLKGIEASSIDTFYLYFNVSSTNSEQCKLCVHSPLYIINTRLLWKQTIGGNGS